MAADAEPTKQGAGLKKYLGTRTFLGQASCAAVAGICQMYGGGIVLDTISTRLQAGFGIGQSLWGIRGYAHTPPAALFKRVAARYARSPLAVRARFLARSNLYAGIGVVVRGRFPYLAMNLGTYQLIENYLVGDDVDADGKRRAKTLGEQLTCIVGSTSIGAAAITAIECPKILDQLKGGQIEASQRQTVVGVIKRHGLARLMQGYEACFLREFCFNVALLGGPGFARVLRERYVEPELRRAEPSLAARALDGRELFAVSLGMGFPVGFITNMPDQMKTNIQKGQFRHIGQAIKWQVTEGGGIHKLLGRAAVYRSLYICHGVVFLNFARTKVEKLLSEMLG